MDLASNVFVTGMLYGSTNLCGGVLPNMSDSFAAKLDPSGGHLWSKTFGVSSTQEGIIGAFGSVDGAGGVWLTGNNPGTADFGGGPLMGMGAATSSSPG